MCWRWAEAGGEREPFVLLVGQITAADQGTREDDLEPRGLAQRLVLLETVGVDPAVEREVVAGGLEVLPDRDDVAGVAAGLIAGIARA